MRDLFNKDGTPILTGIEFGSQKLAEVIKKLDLDFLGIVEGPDTLQMEQKLLQFN